MSATTTTKSTPTKSTKADPTAAPVRDLGADLSPAVKALETAYRLIQRKVEGLPAVTIVVKRDAKAWGHTTVHEVWGQNGAEAASRLEIMISGENLRRGAQHVVATLLHEAAHARNLAAGVRDCDVNGRHNTKFRDGAADLGLIVAEAGWHGWTDTHLDAAGIKRWAPVIRRVEQGLAQAAVAVPHTPAALGGPATGGAGDGAGGISVVPPKRGGRRNLIKAECLCGLSIRVSGKVLEVAQPTCQVCGQVFKPVD